MPTLVIENVPAPLLERIQRVAEEQQRTPAEAAIQMLERVLLSEAPLPHGPALTTEIAAPFDLPRPEGVLVDPKDIVYVKDYVPQPHDVDLPGME
jgi:hypothetical protein